MKHRVKKAYYIPFFKIYLYFFITTLYNIYYVFLGYNYCG
jgi:hypothetical protein